MDKCKIDGKWLFANIRGIPWDAIAGGEVITDAGERLIVGSVIERGSNKNPHITVTALGNSTFRDGLYNVEAFKNGFFTVLIPSARNAHFFTSVLEECKRLRVATEAGKVGQPGDRTRVHETAASRKALIAADRQRVREEAKQKRLREESAQPIAEQEGASPKTVTTSDPTESRQFDLFIFDLDDTLLSTEGLDAFRGKERIGVQGADYLNALRDQAMSLVHLVPEQFLLSLQEEFPDLKLSIFTRSPRHYALTLLKSCFPKVQWDSVIAYEDVVRTKPHPGGIYLAMQRACVKYARRVALIWDGKTDVIAAYQAGVQSILYMPGWGDQWASRGNPNRRDHYKTIEFMPDAKITTTQELRRLVTDPIAFLPCLEAWDADSTLNQRPEEMRVDTRKHFNELVDAGNPNWVETHALGRYFASTSSLSRYDFNKREMHHLATKAILDAKDGIAYPKAWAECCANYISGYAQELRHMKHHLLVCSIPSNPGSIRPLGRDRLVDLFNAISTELKGRVDVQFQCDVLDYAAGASSNKMLNQEARFANVRDHMVVSNANAVRGKAVLVVDDVVTSGATFFYAARYLQNAGAQSVRCLALTQTIS